ncbi:hypothetical protein WA158_006470 [Blastocystis sp. Blastoise]
MIADTQKDDPYMNRPIKADGSVKTDIENQIPPITQGKYFWLIVLPVYGFFLAIIALAYFYLDANARPFSNPLWAKLFGSLMICSYCFLIWEKIHYYGYCGFYESFWYCHQSLLYCGVAFLLNLPSVVCMTLCMVLIPHIAFYVDIICYPIFGVAPANAGGFLYDKNWPLHTKLVTLHHFWYIPGCLFFLYDYPILPFSGYLLSLIFFSWSQIWCHFLTPIEAPDLNGKMCYINVCISFDAPTVIYNVPPYKYALGRPYIFFFIISILFYSVPVNFVSYGVFYLLQKFVLYQH